MGVTRILVARVLLRQGQCPCRAGLRAANECSLMQPSARERRTKRMMRFVLLVVPTTDVMFLRRTTFVWRALFARWRALPRPQFQSI